MRLKNIIEGLRGRSDTLGRSTPPSPESLHQAQIAAFRRPYEFLLKQSFGLLQPLLLLDEIKSKPKGLWRDTQQTSIVELPESFFSPNPASETGYLYNDAVFSASERPLTAHDTEQADKWDPIKGRISLGILHGDPNNHVLTLSIEFTKHAFVPAQIKAFIQTDIVDAQKPLTCKPEIVFDQATNTRQMRQQFRNLLYRELNSHCISQPEISGNHKQLIDVSKPQCSNNPYYRMANQPKTLSGELQKIGAKLDINSW